VVAASSRAEFSLKCLSFFAEPVLWDHLKTVTWVKNLTKMAI